MPKRIPETLYNQKLQVIALITPESETPDSIKAKLTASWKLAFGELTEIDQAYIEFSTDVICQIRDDIAAWQKDPSAKSLFFQLDDPDAIDMLRTVLPILEDKFRGNFHTAAFKSAPKDKMN